MLWAVLVLTALVAGCREGPQPHLPDSSPAQTRVWCADLSLPSWLSCADLQLNLESWPTRAVICLQADCMPLGRLRLFFSSQRNMVAGE